jgi:hypothetical protein
LHYARKHIGQEGRNQIERECLEKAQNTLNRAELKEKKKAG